MNYLKKIKILLTTFVASLTFSQSVDTLIKKNFFSNQILQNDTLVLNPKNQLDILGLDYMGDRDLFKFNKVQGSDVNGFNGKVNISLPIYDIKLDDLTIPIQLLYNSGGVKVDQFATEVGLGWSLNAGPVINKEIVGISDYASTWKSTQSEGLQEYMAGYLTPEPSYGIDSPDIYNISFNTGESSFYIDKSFNPVLISPFNGFNVSFTYGRLDEQFVKKFGYYRNFSGVSGVCASRPFVPTYLFGYYSDYHCENVFRTYKDTKSIDVLYGKYNYSFRDIDYSIPVTATTLPPSCPPNGTPCWNNTSSKIGRFTNKYSITDIKSNLTQKKVNFFYEELSGSNSYVRNSKIFNVIKEGINEDYYMPSEIVDAYTQSYDIYIKRLISKIVTDEEEIEFVYNRNREDSKSLDIVLNSPTNWTTYYKDPLLSKIYIKNKKNTIICTYSFNYGYFDSQCTNHNLQQNPEQCKRLKLASIVKSTHDILDEIEEYILEYYEDTPLPKIGSNRIDPFGYKSSLSDVETSEFDLIFQTVLPKRPKLFSYTDNISGSIDKLYYLSSIKIPSLNPTESTGYEQILANLENSKAWSLKSITYPTKGKQSFHYELNSFLWRGNIVNGGGIRVSKIDIVDDSSVYSTNFMYENGNVISLPTYNGYWQQSYVAGNVQARPQDFYPKLYPLNGSIVTYDKMIKIIDDMGKIITQYTSINDFPLKLNAIHNATSTLIDLFPYYFGVGNLKFNYLLKKDFIGRTKNEYIHDKNNILLKEINYTYSNQENSFPSNYPIIKNLSYSPGYNDEFYPIGYPGGYNPNPKLNYLDADYKKIRNNLTNEKITDYLINNNIVSTKNYTYLDNYNSIKSITNILSNNVLSEEFLFPFESGIQYNSSMANDYRYKFVSNGKKVVKNSNFIKGNLNIFNFYNQNMLLVAESKQILSDNSLVTEITNNQYDNKGNLQQYTTKSSVPTAIIWGYNQTQPIAKIEGAKLSEISTTHISTIVDASNADASDAEAGNPKEQLLINALDSFRTQNPTYQITTYTYDPLVGVRSITPPSGIREIYKYDSSNRLQQVVDVEGKILKEYSYKYSILKYYNIEKSQSFTRNNCGGNAVGSSYTYIVAANKYSSFVSQADADQKAQNDINTNGQNAANQYGTCTPIVDCGFTRNNIIPSRNLLSQSVKLLGNTVNFSVSFSPQNINVIWSNPTAIGFIPNPNCRPIVEKIASYNNGNNSWNIKTKPNGEVNIQLTGGTVNPNTFLPPVTVVYSFDK